MAKTALIAESSKPFLEALTGALSLLGFTVVGTTPKRSEVVALAQETKPDLLIFDCHMSGGETTGFSDLQRLKEQIPEMKIIALGHHENMEGVLERFLNLGFHGYWNKYDNWAGLLKQLGLLFP